MPSTIRVGIADDDEMVRVTLTHSLNRAAGVHVVEAVDDGEPAVSLAQSGTIDVLILDLEMPTMGGAEALRQIRRLAPSVAVIIHSSRPASKAAAGLLQAGGSTMLRSPALLNS